MIYLKFFIFYSIIGFIFESTIFKITKSNKYSGILYGPYTIIYGFGGILCFIINNLLFISNKFLNYVISFIFFMIICMFIEYIGGNLIKYIFKTDKWNYSNHKYHFGKYICLDYALIWGFLALIFVKIFNKFFIKIVNTIPNNWVVTILLLIIIDFILTIIKIKNKD